MKLIFMGTPDFSVPTLCALHEAGHDIVAVYTQPPRPAGRGKKEQKSPVHKTAEALGLTVRTPQSLKTDEAQQEFAALNAECAVVVAYGLILPQPVLDAPALGCINVHASLLPRWRGAAPIHRAVMAGDRETGVCIMQMEAGLDTGPVLDSGVVPIGARTTTQELHDTLARLGADLINPALSELAQGENVAVPQPETGVTYARKIEKTEARIEWQENADHIDRQVRGLYPFPGAWTMIGGERVKILAGHVRRGNTTAVAGTVLDDALLIACGQDSYQVERAQRAGKGPMDLTDFLRGFPVPAGTRVDGDT